MDITGEVLFIPTPTEPLLLPGVTAEQVRTGAVVWIMLPDGFPLERVVEVQVELGRVYREALPSWQRIVILPPGARVMVGSIKQEVPYGGSSRSGGD